MLTNSIPLGNEAVAHFLANVGRTEMTVDAVAKLKEQSGNLQLREAAGLQCQCSNSQPPRKKTKEGD